MAKKKKGYGKTLSVRSGPLPVFKRDKKRATLKLKLA